MNEECFLEASNRSRDKLRSGSRQTAVLFNTSCCLVDGDLRGSDQRKLAQCVVVVVPRWS